MTQTAQTAITPLRRLAKVLQLGTPSTYRSHTYVNGESLYFPTGRVYGGQVIAQAMMAASKTVPPSRLPNSIHAISFPPAIFVRICCLMWRICVMAARFPLVA